MIVNTLAMIFNNLLAPISSTDLFYSSNDFEHSSNDF